MITLRTTVKIANGKTANVELNFNSEDPAAVTFTFENRDGTLVNWIFGRDLLKEALESGLSGSCDVLFELDEDEIMMGLVSPKSKGYVRFSQEVIVEFVELVYEEVPDGEDSYEFPEYVPEEWLV